MIKRIVLFLITNLAVLFVLNITMRLLGIDTLLAESGGGLESERAAGVRRGDRLRRLVHLAGDVQVVGQR